MQQGLTASAVLPLPPITMDHHTLAQFYIDHMYSGVHYGFGG